ncbi:MAG: hypothetical protein QY332_10355 [Anaerolineales bacterium]|nr:MAG: hypothetical protein QY332_10355 [Anaerolineales bacterium]
MTEGKDFAGSVRESLSTVFRHILPGVIILAVSSLSIPDWLKYIDITNTISTIVLAVIALAVGNAWYVFHRYFVLQVVDYLFYLAGAKGQPRKEARSDYRGDLAKHVSKFFLTLPEQIAMGRHIRDRFSSFNFMYVVSEAFIIFAFLADDLTFLGEHKTTAIIGGVLGFLAATWQYSIVRLIDEKFVELNS